MHKLKYLLPKSKIVMSSKTEQFGGSTATESPTTTESPSTLEKAKGAFGEKYENAEKMGVGLETKLNRELGKLAPNDDHRGQAMMQKIIGLVVAVSVGLVVAFQLLPTVFESWGTLQGSEEIPDDVDGLVTLIPIFGVLAIALVFLGALMYGVRQSSGNGF